jgi:hypothetical protein
LAVEQDHLGGQVRDLRRQGQGRKDRVYCPRWVALFGWLKPVLSTPLGELPIRKSSAELMPRIDAEVAALGRSTSAYN